MIAPAVGSLSSLNRGLSLFFQTRPLHTKLEVLLDLVFRRLYYDPEQPLNPYNTDGFIKAIKRIDKEMGP